MKISEVTALRKVLYGMDLTKFNYPCTAYMSTNELSCVFPFEHINMYWCKGTGRRVLTILISRNLSDNVKFSNESNVKFPEDIVDLLNNLIGF